MTLHQSDTVIDRVSRVKHSIAGNDPRVVQVAVDGPCPTKGCDARVIAEVHSDSHTVVCAACGTEFIV